MLPAHDPIRKLIIVSFVLFARLSAARTALASDHPGNIHLVGDEVRVDVPDSWAGWLAVDVDGKEIGRSTSPGHNANLGVLPIGYFEILEQNGPGKITGAVLAETTPVETTPIAVDAAMSWFYSDERQIRDACALCRLAGVKWVRDRLSWPEIETARGTWAEDGRYERAMRIQREEGLKILQVNHISPAWATTNPSRFPEDLRDVYAFYRGLAKRWQGLADAIEPWNEPDIVLFGGHTGCEIASFQKAAYLGLKAGNPQQPVCDICFAIDRAETLDEFGANKVYPYFDIYNLHHYIGMPAYARAYGRHRATSGGRPMWTTEFNLPVHWADEQTKEPSEEELRMQAYRVGKVFASALHQGTEKAFYFILGDYVERNLQYGLVHRDLTPRPAYVAFAAVGRLLNGAEPIGRVDLGDDKLFGYLFRTQVGGAEKETLVAWSETNWTDISIPSVEIAYDCYGRELPAADSVQLTRSTVFLVLPQGASRQLSVEPPPAKATWQTGTPCPAVLQLVGAGDVDQSAFRLDATNELRLVAYNFGDDTVRGNLSLEGATGGPVEIEIRPGDRLEFPIEADGPGNVTARLDLQDRGEAIVSAGVIATEFGNNSRE